MDDIGSYRDGLELGGTLADDAWHWSAAVTRGVKDEAGEALADAAGDFAPNVFLRAARRGENSRFGAFAYVGRNTLARSAAGRVQTWEDDLLRVGADADVWASKLNLYGVYMYGRNSDSLPGAVSGGLGESANFHGGFVQADYHAIEKPIAGFIKEVALVLSLRGNLVRQPAGSLSTHETSSSVYPGARLLVRERFRLTFEYGFQGQQRADGGAVQAELVF